MGWLKALWLFIEEIFKKKVDDFDPINNYDEPIITPMEEPIVTPPVPQETQLDSLMVAPKLEWDTPTKARHSARVVMDEMGLTGVVDTKTGIKAKDLLCAVISCESGFNIKAKNVNKDGTGDYGICQMNSYWYIGKGKPIESIDEALNNPEKCIRVMVQKYKQGLLKNWVCYSAGYYKKHLK